MRQPHPRKNAMNLFSPVIRPPWGCGKLSAWGSCQYSLNGVARQ